MITELISAIVQIIVFTMIPLIIYMIRVKTYRGFLEYIGLKKASSNAIFMAMGASIILFIPLLILVMTNSDFKEIMHTPTSMTGKFKVMGLTIESTILILILAIFKTALAEEILFRGFLAKRLIAVSSYQVGNIIQAIIFGIIHSLLFMSISSNIFFLTIIFIFPAMGAYIKTYINEKKANGSIVPGWAMHATSNLLSYFVIGLYV